MSSMTNAILMYHDVYDTLPEESGFLHATAIPYKITTRNFEMQLQGIVNWAKESNIKHQDIRLTFDDGGKSFLTFIAPMLEKYQFKGYFFITTSLIGTPTFLTENDIIELYQRGHYIGAHSHTHPGGMRNLPKERLVEEWSSCCKILERIISKPITIASIPGGSASSAVYDVLLECGIKDIYISDPGLMVKTYKTTNLFPRYGVKSFMSNDYVVSILSNKKTRLKIGIKKKVLLIAKRTLGGVYLTLRRSIYQQKA